jgi:putative ABC transport system ATP-binding protein
MSIHLKNISIPYISSNRSELWNHNIHFEQGKYYHIKAASGKGKSSLIRTLFGIQKDFLGEILIDEKNTKHISVEDWCDLRASKISIVFQDLKLLNDHTAFMNIELKRGLTNYYVEDKIVELAERLDIKHILHRKIDTLSYGERQRVAIVRALMQDYQYLLLDEPFSHLDEQNIFNACTLIQDETMKRNASICIVDLEDDDRFKYHQKLLL